MLALLSDIFEFLTSLLVFEIDRYDESLCVISGHLSALSCETFPLFFTLPYTCIGITATSKTSPLCRTTVTYAIVPCLLEKVKQTSESLIKATYTQPTVAADAKFPQNADNGSAPSPTRENPGQVRTFYNTALPECPNCMQVYPKNDPRGAFCTLPS